MIYTDDKFINDKIQTQYTTTVRPKSVGRAQSSRHFQSTISLVVTRSHWN